MSRRDARDAEKTFKQKAAWAEAHPTRIDSHRRASLSADRQAAGATQTGCAGGPRARGRPRPPPGGKGRSQDGAFRRALASSGGAAKLVLQRLPWPAPSMRRPSALERRREVPSGRLPTDLAAERAGAAPRGKPRPTRCSPGDRERASGAAARRLRGDRRFERRRSGWLPGAGATGART